MAKKTLFLLFALILMASLTACSVIQLPWASASTRTAQANSLTNFASQPEKNKLAVGLLKLEGSGLAITSAQAKELLPLWKAVKSLSTDSNTTTGEMAALYVQIEGVLTNSQVQAIEKMDLSASELTALEQEYSAQTVVSGSTFTSTASQTTQSSQTQGGEGGPGGDIQGVSDPNLGGILGDGQVAAQSSASNSSSTSTSSKVSQSNLNLLLADPVISLLNARISSLGA